MKKNEKTATLKRVKKQPKSEPELKNSRQAETAEKSEKKTKKAENKKETKKESKKAGKNSRESQKKAKEEKKVSKNKSQGPSKDQLKRMEKLTSPYKITNGKSFKLTDIDPSDTQGLGSEVKEEASELLAIGTQWLADLQDKLYAQDKWGVLIIFQAMDAAGKDGTIKHVMSGVNPQGCQVFSFKQPSSEDLDHDFMWRYFKCFPERGRIGIFNRSYYEEVLVVRVHNLLKNEKLPEQVISKNIWQERLEDIRAFEKYLERNGIVVLKFYLHLSKKEQKKRFLARINRPEKHWKFSSSDVKEREYWNDYMKAFEDAIRSTASKESPWYVVPADNKWFSRLVVAAAIVETLESLELKYPDVGPEKMKELAIAKLNLEKE